MARIKRRLDLAGLPVSVEYEKGDSRNGYKFQFPYGYIRGTKGTDGDHVDVYIGPDQKSDSVFIVNQMKKSDEKIWKTFDEQKVMGFFTDAAAAKAAYLKQYNDPRFFGGMKEMPVEDFKAKVMEKENHGKKIARLMTELSLSRLAAGQEPVTAKVATEILGGDPGVTAIPPQTAYAKATMSKEDRKEADQEMKEAGLSHSHETTRGLDPEAVAEGKRVEAEHTKDPNTARQIAIDHLHEDPQYYKKLREVEKKSAEGRVGRIADRVDDVGIGLLAAPYVADVAGHGLAKMKNPKLKSLGTAISRYGTNTAFGKSHGREIAGLAMVAPGVTHTLAKGVDKVLPKSKTAELEKIAQRFYPDYEYMAESEKRALVQALGRLGAKSVGLVGKGIQAGKQGVQAGKSLAQAPGLVDRAAAGFQSARLGRQVSPQVVQRGRQMAQGKATRDAAFGGQRIIDPRGKTLAEAGAAKVRPSAVPVVPPPASPGGFKSPLNAKNLALGGGVAALGLTAYGGYKGIQTTANLLQHQHEGPLASQAFVGPGRVV